MYTQKQRELLIARMEELDLVISKGDGTYTDEFEYTELSYRLLEDLEENNSRHVSNTYLFHTHQTQ